jgi:hypothetical protein
MSSDKKSFKVFVVRTAEERPSSGPGIGRRGNKEVFGETCEEGKSRTGVPCV